MGRALTFALLAGCGPVFGLDRLPDAAPPPPICAEGCACDDFAGVDLDVLLWNPVQNNGVVVAQDEQLHVDMRALAGHVGDVEGGVRFAGIWDLTGAAVELEVPQVIGAGEFVENYIRLMANGNVGMGYVMRYSNDELGMWTRIGGIYDKHADRPYDPELHRFWRIAHNAELDRITFSTRPNENAAWDVAVDVSRQVAVTNIQILLIAGTYRTGAPDPGVVAYDNFALCGGARL